MLKYYKNSNARGVQLKSYISIVETKFVPPAIKESYIRRPSLMRKMKTLSSHKLTFIHSGAGFGKSTAISQYLQDFKQNYCWYSITQKDDDIIPFITYIVHSIKRKFDHFGKEILQTMADMDQYIREEDLYRLYAIFINECMLVKEDFLIIIDDYHLVDHSFLINQWLEKVIEYLPSHIHFVILSRAKPNWKSLLQLKVANDLLEMTEKDLCFTKEETEILLTNFHERMIPESTIDTVYSLTEGWVIAISMIYHQMQQEEVIDFNDQYASLDELFHYLALEVFLKQSPVVQQFLKQISILEEITPLACDELFDVPGSEIMLKQLSHKNTLLQEMKDSNHYRLHSLFQSFLEKKLKEDDPILFKRLHERAAYYFEANGQWEQAIYHYKKNEHTQAVASILLKQAPYMLKHGHLEGLNEHLKELDEDTMNQFYPLWFYQGEFFRYRSFYEKAEKCFIKVIEKASQQQEYYMISKAYEGIGRIYLDTIQPGRAERYLFRAIQALEKVEGSYIQDKTRLYFLTAENLVNSGKASKAQRWYHKGKQENIDLNEGNLESRMLLRTGKLADAKKVLEGRENEEHLPQSHRETELLLSLIEAFMGNGPKAKALAQFGIQQGIKNKSPFVEACGWIRMGHAVQLIEGYDWQLAEKCYETSLDLMNEINVSRGKAEPLMGLSILYGRLGNYRKSIELSMEALHETDKVEDLWLGSLIRLCMAITDYYQHRFPEAKKNLELSKEQFKSCGDQYGYMLTELWNSMVAFQLDEEESFKTSFKSCLNEVQIGQYEFVFSKLTTFGPKDLQSLIPLLVKAYQEGVHTSFCLDILSKLGYDEITSHPGFTLKVKTLGVFSVYLGDHPVVDKAWQREKAKELFQFFLMNRDKILPKEEIILEMWPDEESGDRDFKVALNALNNALEPQRKSRAKSYFIQRVNEGYRLNPGAVIEYDALLFRDWVTEGLTEKELEQARLYLERGLSYYKGEFLPDRKGKLWTEKEREHLNHLFLRGMEKLAQISIKNKQFDAAINYCTRILENDSLWEEAYRIIMFSYYQKNNRPQAIKWFRKCKQLLRDELDVSPMAATMQMYELIMESKNVHYYDA